MRSPRRSEGFTLLELMVALVAGAIAISAIYTVSASSTRHFHEQQKVAESQMSLRMAMTQLRADIARAGLYGAGNSDTANPTNLQNCPRPSPRLQAVELMQDPDSDNFPEFAANNIEFDRIRLVGNYATTSGYLAMGATTSNQVRLQTSAQAFRRDFSLADEAGSVEVSASALEAAFAPGRYLHLRTLQATSVFAPITAVLVSGSELAPDVRINVGAALPITTPCMPGMGDGALLAPLSRVEYVVLDPRTAPELSVLDPKISEEEADALGLRSAVLVRRELPFDCSGESCEPIEGSTRVVLENVADFDVRVITDTQLDRDNPPTLELFEGAAAETAAGSGALRPEAVRSVIVRLSVRTQGTQPQFAGPARAAGEPLTRFVVEGAIGAARVRTAEAEIFLPNLVPGPR